MMVMMMVIYEAKHCYNQPNMCECA